MSKIASTSTKIFMKIHAFGSTRKSNVFFSFDWSPVVKNEDEFENFTGAYIGEHGKIHSKHRLLIKISFFQLEASVMKKALILQFLAVVGVSV